MAAAVALVATACGPIEHKVASTLPPPPPVIEANTSPPNAHADGRFRAIVTPTADLADPGIADPNTSPDSAPTSPQERWTIDPDRLAEVPANALLEFRDGVPGYVDVHGRFVALVGAADEDPSPPSPTPLPHDDHVLALLRSTDGVESAQPIGDGSYAVVTSSPDALDGLTVHTVEDIPFAFSNDPYRDYQWPLENTGDNLRSLALSPMPEQISDADLDGGEELVGGPTGQGVVIAVVDSGIDFTHPDLGGSSWINDDENCSNGIDDDGNGYIDDCRGWDFGNDDPQTFDGTNDSHGTHLAGLISAAADNRIGVAGLAPATAIMDLSVAQVGPNGPTITASSIARAIRYAVDNGADIVNLSLASAPGAPAASVAPIVDAVRHAGANNVLVVAAAGNNGVDLSQFPVYPASIDAPNLLVVGASTPSDTKASFSNFGQAVDLFAPGAFVLSTVPGNDYAFQSGTSQAAPLAAAVAALVLEERPELTPTALIQQLIGTADEQASLVGVASNDVRINAARAIGRNPESEVITIRGLAAATIDGVVADVEIGETSGQFNQPFHWEATLIAVRPEGSFAIVDHPVSITDGREAVDSSTNERGAVELAASDAAAARLSTVLPAGTYALLVEAVPLTDSTVRLGEAHLVTFDIDAPANDADTDPNNELGNGPGRDEAPGGGATPTPGPTPGQPPTPDATAPGGPTTNGGTGSTSSTSVPGQPPRAPTTPTVPGTDPSPPPSSTTPGNGQGPSTTSGTTAESNRSENNRSEAGDPAAPTPSTTVPTGVDRTEPTATTSRPAGTSPTTATTRGTPVTVGPDQVADGPWSITAIAPRSGLVNTENPVILSGTFPEDVVVWFGNSPGTVTSQSATTIKVRTPLQSRPGVVDITLRSRASGVVLTLPNAFAYLSAGDTTPVAEGGGGGATGGGSSQTPSSPVGTSTTLDGRTPATAPPAPPTTAGNDDPRGGNDRQRQARARVGTDPIDLGNGLRGVSISGVGGGVPACTSDPCRTRRI